MPQKVDLMQDKSDKTNVMLKISNFVDQMQIQSEETDQQQQMDQVEPSLNRPRSSINAPGLDEAQRRMEQAIVETEKFKAAVENPPGMLPLNTMLQGINQFEVPTELNLVEQQQDHPGLVRQVIGAGGTSDDDFFHLTCHIDPNLKKKIENGEFVDLDKLLPKDQTFQGRSVTTNETKLEWVQSEGSTYLVPAKSVSRVNCFRHWEQAFRMYATIYCTKNPNRAREIWQYISVINTASMSYNWDNVYNYDIVFRQLMEFNPNRSWAVTYNQMWKLSMTNPITQNQARRSFGNGSQNNSNNGQQQSGHAKRKLDYCWSFNKGVKCKFGKKCKFIERCSYCDDPSHGVINCNKLEKKDSARGGGKRGTRSK